MKNLLKSKISAIGALVLCIIFLILTFTIRKDQWWMFIDIFFIFMAIFSHLMALTIEKLNAAASRKLDTIAFWLIVVGVAAFIGEWIAFNTLL